MTERDGELFAGITPELKAEILALRAEVKALKVLAESGLSFAMHVHKLLIERGVLPATLETPNEEMAPLVLHAQRLYDIALENAIQKTMEEAKANA